MFNFRCVIIQNKKGGQIWEEFKNVGDTSASSQTAGCVSKAAQTIAVLSYFHCNHPPDLLFVCLTFYFIKDFHI